jgi:sodium pump decarboxylase gamma subunit
MFEGINGALQVAIIDMILVFAVLGGLALVMILLKNIIGITEIKKTTKETMIAPPTTSTVKVKEKEEVDGKLVAVITAAVASYLEKQRSEFKVVSIRKYKSSVVAPWTVMGRQELMLREK